MNGNRNGKERTMASTDLDVTLIDLVHERGWQAILAELATVAVAESEVFEDVDEVFEAAKFRGVASDLAKLARKSARKV